MAYQADPNPEKEFIQAHCSDNITLRKATSIKRHQSPTTDVDMLDEEDPFIASLRRN